MNKSRQASSNRSAPINLRALPEQRDLIDLAAGVLNKTRSDFMLETACVEAENVLLDRRLFLVDDDAFHQFDEMLNTSISNNPKLRALMEHKAPWEK